MLSLTVQEFGAGAFLFSPKSIIRDKDERWLEFYSRGKRQRAIRPCLKIIFLKSRKAKENINSKDRNNTKEKIKLRNIRKIKMKTAKGKKE